MTVLNRLYASSGEEVIIETLQIDVGDKTFWLTKGFDDITATLEDGSIVTFIACGIDLALPARNADGTQDLKFAISNITGVVSSAIRKALPVIESSQLTYRCFTSNDLGAPAERPFSLIIKSGYWTSTQVQITAGYMNVLDTAWPRYRYTLNFFPGLRYIA